MSQKEQLDESLGSEPDKYSCKTNTELLASDKSGMLGNFKTVIKKKKGM